ncbi:MAG: AAA family ATPase [Rubrivivax sp.]|nr:AAA family ATPase [Rubrivivax sp.]
MNQLSISAGRCQFCHRTAESVPRLIAGDSAFICSDCVSSCNELLGPEKHEENSPTRGERYLFERLARHFEPLRTQELIATSRTYPLRQQADLQLALDQLFGAREVPENFVGVHQPYRHEVLGFAKLLEQGRNAVEIGPAQYEDVQIGRGETVSCLKNGLWLLQRQQSPFALLLAQHHEYGRSGDCNIEILAAPGETGSAICSQVFGALEQRLSKDSCYRGRVLSLEQQDPYSGHAARVYVHELDTVAREDVILPEQTLAAVERNVLVFAEQRPALRKLGMSTQKGLLFHGPPGTGKTHCIRFLAGRLPHHTTLLITAEEVGLLPHYMGLARLLQPALVVIEDADLIARNRGERTGACDEAMLNRLLNEMDGLRERADVFFILTTNRPETLEPALAGRPGRIDQTIEFPLPTAALRQRLISLYARDLPLPALLTEELAQRTDGTSPAFIKELLRRIAQHHLEASHEGDVTRDIAEAALHEMLFSGGELNARLLGGAVPEPVQL